MQPFDRPGRCGSRPGRAAFGAGVLLALAALTTPAVAQPVAVPAGGLARTAPTWRTVFADGFNGTRLGAAWTAYSGRPGTGSRSTWRASRVRVGRGVLTLSAVRAPDGTWTTGGVGAFSTTARYGRFTARIRLSAGHGLWAAALLFPVHGWPPELDYYEIFGGDGRRGSMTATTHGAPGNRMQHITHLANYQAWHVISMIWTPTSIRYLVDGTVTGTTTDVSLIPQQPMWPAFQIVTGVGDGQTPVADTPRVVRLQVDWFRIAERG